MTSMIYFCACALLIGAPAAFAQSADTAQTQSLAAASSNTSSGLQPSGLRTTTQPLSAGPPAPAQYVGPNWQSPNNQTPGHSVDGWTFFPIVTGATYFDDNVFATPTNRQSDWAFLLRPELAVTKGGQDYGIEAHAYVEGRKYVQFDSEDQLNGGASLGGTVMLDPNNQFQGRAQYKHGHEDRGVGEEAQVSGAPPTVFDHPVAFDQFDTAAAFNHRQDRWWTSVGGAATVIHFTNPTITGVPQDQSFRDGYVASLPSRLGYVVAPFTSVFVEGTPNTRQFEVSDFDSNGYRVVGGMMFEPGQGQRMKGEFFAGYMNQSYQGATFHDVSTWTFGASMAFLLTDRLTMTLQGNRQALETALTCAVPDVFVGCGSSLVESWAGARFDYLVLKNLVVGVGATYLVDDVIGGARSDTYLRPLFSVKYLPNPWLTLGFDYRNLNYESTGFAVPGYTRNVYLFSATARF